MSSIEQLYLEHHQPLRRYLERLVEDRTTAEDVCHESSVKALQYWDDRDQAASARGWLYCTPPTLPTTISGGSATWR